MSKAKKKDRKPKEGTRKLSKAKEAVKEAEKGAEKIEEEVAKAGSAIRKEARRVERAVEGRAEWKGPQRPAGRVPEPMVVSRHGTGMVTRQGRGFSQGELSGVGLATWLAARWGVRVDLRRRSVLDGNVSSLKAWQAHPGAMARAEAEGRKAEEDLVRAGKLVVKEVEAAEKEAVKGAKQLKKEAKKAEKAVKERVGRKPRPKKKKT